MFAFLAASRSKKSPSKPASTSTGPSSASPNHNIFFPIHRHEVTHVILLSPGHLPESQANTRRKRIRNDSLTSQPRAAPVVNSHSALTHRPAVANSSRRRAPLPKILPSPGTVTFRHSSALKILCELPEACDISRVKTSPSVNTLAKGDPTFDDRLFLLKPWTAVYNRTHQVEFVEAMQALPSVFIPSPGGFRILENETDAKEAFIVNVIAPILPILNACLSGDHSDKLQIQLFSEVQKSETGRRRTDHAIMLVDTLQDGKGLRVLKVKQALVIIEAKRHDLIDANDWEEISKVKVRRLADHEENMKIILPQVLMYCDSWECSRAILTDYSDTIAVDVDRSRMEHTQAPLRLSYIDVSTLTGREDVFSYGPRASIAFQVFQALRELGLLDKKLFPHAQGKPEGLLHRYLFPNQHSSPTPPPPPPPPRKEKVQQPLTQPTKSQPRKTHNSKNAGYAEAVRGGH